MNISKTITSAILLSAVTLTVPAMAQKGWKKLPPEFKEGKEKVQRQVTPNQTKKQSPQNSKKGFSRAQRKSDAVQTYFELPQTRFYAQGLGGTIYAKVEAHNTTWEIAQAPKDWVTLSDKSTAGICLNIGENPSAESRSTAMLLRASDGTTRWIEIYQNGSVKFEVTDIDFANTDIDGEKFYSDFGAPLYSRELNYLFPRVTYNGPEKAMAKSANVRIIFPDRSVDEAEKEGDFSYEYVLNCEPGQGNTATLYPWGDNVRRRGIPYYMPGEYALELWIDDELAFTKPFHVKLKPDEYGAEIIDYWVEHNYQQDGEPGMLVHSTINSQNMDGYKINYCIFFYDDEGGQLRDNRDRPISVYETQDVESNDHSWNDWTIFVPYSTITPALNGDRNFRYKIEIQNGETFRPLSRIKDLSHSL